MDGPLGGGLPDYLGVIQKDMVVGEGVNFNMNRINTLLIDLLKEVRPVTRFTKFMYSVSLDLLGAQTRIIIGVKCLLL